MWDLRCLILWSGYIYPTTHWTDQRTLLHRHQFPVVDQSRRQGPWLKISTNRFMNERSSFPFYDRIPCPLLPPSSMPFNGWLTHRIIIASELCTGEDPIRSSHIIMGAKNLQPTTTPGQVLGGGITCLSVLSSASSLAAAHQISSDRQ